MTGRALIRTRATASKDPARRLDELEASLVQLSDDAEAAFSVGGKWEIVKATSNYTAKPWQFVLCDPTSAAFGVMLPAASACKLAQVIVKNDSSSSNAITVLVQSNGTIDGASTVTLNAGRQFKQFISDGREWKDTGASVGPLVVQIGTDANVTALPNRLVFIPPTTAIRTLSLPASPADGTFVRVLISNATDFVVTVSGNGKNIDDRFGTIASTVNLQNEGQLAEFIYLASQNVWMLASRSIPVYARRLRYHTADANTVALWNGFGDKTDSSGNGLTLALGAGTERYAEVGYGLQGFALDGATYFKRAGNDAALNLPGDMTVEAIVRPLATPAGLGAGVICGYGAPGETGGNDNVFWQMSIGDATVGGNPVMTGVASFSFFQEHGAGINDSNSSGTLIPLHEPRHLAWVRTGTTIIPYLNGFAQPSFTLTLGTLGGAPTQFATIGADFGGGNLITGVVASVKISNMARSAGYVMRDALRCVGVA